MGKVESNSPALGTIEPQRIVTGDSVVPNGGSARVGDRDEARVSDYIVATIGVSSIVVYERGAWGSEA